jgi:glycosyltransferase involved in cell wall biosynthesis
MRAFENLGWEVRPYIVGDKVPLSWVEKEGDLILGRSYARLLGADLMRLVLGSYHFLRAPRVLAQMDLVYERFGAFQALGYAFQRRGVPWIVETNGLLFEETSKDRNTVALTSLERRLELWVYRQADVVVAVTETLKDLLSSHGVPREKVVVLPNGVDVRRFEPSVPPKRMWAGPTVGFVGTLYSWQGLDLLLRGVHALLEEGVELWVTVVGDGPLRGEWEGLARTLGLQDRVAFVGRVPWEEVPSYIAGFDLGYSGQVPLAVGVMYHSPLKIYEYLAMAKPVVASLFEEAKRVVVEGETGFLFDGGSLESLKSALRRAYAARKGWAAMGQKGRQVVLASCSWEARVRDLSARVKEILGGRYEKNFPFWG